jgi:uncharacterized RDD family membrane protein YckC
VTKKPRKAATKPKPAKAAKLVHAPPIDARPNAAAPASPPPQRSVAAAPAVDLAEAKAGVSPAVPVGFFVLLAAASLVLVFAAIPRQVLGNVSTRLTEHRDDIGIAITLGMTVIVVTFLLVVVYVT